MAKDEEKTLMSPGEMKPLLLLSKREPVNCAIGMTKDKTGIVLLDKKMKPRKLFATIKAEAAKAKIEMDMGSVRYGKAAVDTAIDSALVTFTVNKSPGGTLRPMILVQLKKAGFSKCEIIVDEKIDDEPDDDQPAADGAAAPAAAVIGADAPAAPAAQAPSQAADGSQPTPEQAAFVQQAMGTDSAADPGQPAAPAAAAAAGAAQPAADQAGSAPAADAPPAGPNPADAAALTKRLTGLVKQMLAGLAANPAGADAMKTAAVAAQTALKGGDVAAATQSADTLERLLNAAASGGAAGGAAAPKGPAMGSPVFAKARATWVATQKKVESEIDKLHAELQSVYKGHGVVADLEKTFRSTVEPTMSKFDDTLANKLDEVNKNTDPSAHAKLVGEVQEMITQYESFLASDPLIAKLDDNPFVPLSIEKTLTMSLSILAKSVN